MPPEQISVPALPVLLPLGLALMVVSWAVLRRRGMSTRWRLGAAWAAGWYAVAVLGATLLPLHLAWGEGTGGPALDQIILMPLTTMRVGDFLLNIVMTVPLAALLHVLFGVRDLGRVVLTGFVLSAVIEITQGILVLTLHGNRWADVNDVIANVLGAWLGYLAFHRSMRIGGVRRAVESSTAMQRTSS